MKKHLAFVASSFEYTRGFLPFVRRLEEHGYTVDWISFRNFEGRWLRNQGVPGEQILDTLRAFDPERYGDHELTERLVRLENGSVPFVNDIILMDRMVRRKSDMFARQYLAHLEEIVTRFLLARGITLVIANERDSALQVTCDKICSRLRIPYVIPTIVRIPDNRYGFCPGYLEQELLTMRPVTAEDLEQARAFLHWFRAERPMPSGVAFARKNSRFILRLHRDLANWLTISYRGLFDWRNDFTTYSARRLQTLFWRRRLNAMHLRVAPLIEPLGRRPFVLYAYHLQPESTIDVFGAFFSDQVALIKQIARSVPATHELYVKSHPDDPGGASRRLLAEIKRMPGVRLINPLENSHQLILRSSLVITPAGTMALEAALHGVPSIVFAREFFADLPLVHHCETPTALPELIQSLIAARPEYPDTMTEAYLARIIANTFEGRVTNYLGPLTDSELPGMVRSYDRLFEVLYPCTGSA